MFQNNILAACLFLITTFVWNSHASPLKMEAASWIVLDESGIIIAGHEVNKKHAPASLTKLMTSYLVMESIKKNNLKWDDSISVTSKALGYIAKDETQMYLLPGTKVKVRDLMGGLIVASANDAAKVLADNSGGDFVTRMNLKARQLGMKNSHFATSTGVTTAGQHTTALDIAKLGLMLSENFPEYFSFSSQKYFTYKSFKKQNTNPLLGRDQSIDGMKTGYTKEAGWNIIVSAKRRIGTEKSSKRIFVVVLGASSQAKRAQYARELIELGFDSIKKKTQLAQNI